MTGRAARWQPIIPVPFTVFGLTLDPADRYFYAHGNADEEGRADRWMYAIPDKTSSSVVGTADLVIAAGTEQPATVSADFRAVSRVVQRGFSVTETTDRDGKRLYYLAPYLNQALSSRPSTSTKEEAEWSLSPTKLDTRNHAYSNREQAKMWAPTRHHSNERISRS